MSFERGRYGRAIFARLRPDEDLVLGVEALCREAGFHHASIRGSLGSLNHATLAVGNRVIEVPHLGLEITALIGEVRAGKAYVAGSLVNGEGRVFSGRFVEGKNRICVTAEITLEEWCSEEEEICAGGC